MAERAKPSDKLLKCFLHYDQTFPSDDPTLNSSIACPVIITFCDAPAYARNFSEAVVDYRLDGGLPLSYLFHVGHDELLRYILGKTEKRNVAITRLENFFDDIEKHTNCLKCLFDKKERDRKGIKNEHHIQVIIAAHLFGPLAGDKSYTIGNKGFSEDVRECPVCKQDITAMLGNTSFGNGSVWHGVADLFVKGSIVKIVEELKLNTSYEGDSSETADDSDRPLRKKRRYMYEDSGDSDNSDSRYESDSVVEVEKDHMDTYAISQGLAQTIVNAYCESRKFDSLEKTFIPSFIASCQHVKITMYNCGLDSLMMSPELSLFVKLDVDQDAVLDLSTILSVWYALNFEINIENSDLFEEMITVSNFKKMAGSKLPLYEKHCSKPMEVKAKLTSIPYRVNFDLYCQLVTKVIHKQSEQRKQLKQFLNEKRLDRKGE